MRRVFAAVDLESNDFASLITLVNLASMSVRRLLIWLSTLSNPAFMSVRRLTNSLSTIVNWLMTLPKLESIWTPML